MPSISADGWRPIIGSSSNIQYRQYPVEQSTGRPVLSSSIQPPSQRHPPLSVQHISHIPSTTSPSTISPTISTPFNNKLLKVQTTHYGIKNKIPQGGKFSPTSNQVFMMPSHGKPHVIPLGPRGPHMTPPTVYRNSPISKMPLHATQKRKPMRVQQTAHSQKDEIFAQAPSSAIGTYTFFNQAIPSNRFRDNSGIGTTKYHIQQPHGHIEFTNHFGLKSPAPNDDIIQAQTLREISNSQFLFQSPNDEFALNLVPPPLAKPFQDKPKEVKNLLKLKPGPLGDSISNTEIEKQNLVLSGLPSTYHPHSPSNPLNKGEQLVDFQITKEKFNVFHNNIPPNYEPQKFPHFESLQVKPLEFHKFPQFGSLSVKPLDNPHIKTHHYEVTEGKQWLEPSQPFQPHFPSSIPTRETMTEVRQQHRTRRPQKQDFQIKPFLPTPLSPDGSNPTLPTQSEASSVYNLVSNKNNIRASINPQFFNIKEVSTHYPIIGDFKTEDPTKEPDYSNEVISDNGPIRGDIHTSATPTQPTDTTTKNTNWENQRNRLNQRRRRPGMRQRTTTETPSSSDDYSSAEQEEPEVTPTEKRQRQRTQSRYRTTSEAPSTTTATNHRMRQRPSEEKRNKPNNRFRVRPTPEEVREEAQMPSNHKMSGLAETTSVRPTKQSLTAGTEYESGDSMELNKVPSSPKTYTTTYDAPILNNFYKQTDSSEEETEVATGHFMQAYDRERGTIQKGQRMRHREQEVRPSLNYEYVDSIEEDDTRYNKRRNKYEETDLSFKVHSTAEPYPTDRLPTTILHTPENEIDYTTIIPERQHPTAAITIQEITKKTTEATTQPSTTSTTVETTTSKLNRIRQRPNKYDNQQRPRFSVKEYRQRLQQATTTTTESSASQKSPNDSPRLRFPMRMRTTSTTQSSSKTEDNTESVTDNPRSKFMPKDPRFRGGVTDSPNEANTEKTFKAVNPRLRPFGRNRATTESPSLTTSSTTQKVSIKPNIFSSLRKPPAISLRTRIQNKNKLGNSTEEKTTAKPVVVDTTEADPSDMPDTTMFNDIKMDLTTEMVDAKKQDVEIDTEANLAAASENAAPDIVKSESFLHSQRVSDLTSSARKEYETPGLFKSVSPNSRRVPNYFTIATDDPRLPIEAFFPNLKSNGKD